MKRAKKDCSLSSTNMIINFRNTTKYGWFQHLNIYLKEPVIVQELTSFSYTITRPTKVMEISLTSLPCILNILIVTVTMAIAKTPT